MRVLLVEDDQMIAEAIVWSLKEENYAVDHVLDGQQATSAISCQPYDIVLLDLSLPRLDGLDVLKYIRNKSDVPVIIITARDTLDEKVKGLDLGADDFVIKPFEFKELHARMRVVIRRKNGATTSELIHGDLSLDLSTHQVTIGQSTAVVLTAKEFRLLEAFMIKPGKILSRAELEDKIYGWGEEVESNAIEFLIFSIRKKIGKAHIKNVRGLGWMIPKNK
jgi:two-component system OmpR family response regulator